jgi:osmotically-inducible protein OsmY
MLLMSETVIARLPQGGLPLGDRSIRDDVTRALRDTGYAPLRGIQCDVSDGVVELTGVVPSFYVKQLAQTAVLRLDQIRGVNNRLRVA